jgi:hypothetical protein
MDSFFNAVWTIADERGWTDNTLLHALVDVLEREPRDARDRILALLGEKE